MSCCIQCAKEVKSNDKALACDGCDNWQHIMCGNIMPESEYMRMLEDGTVPDWCCSVCLQDDKCIACGDAVSTTQAALACDVCNRWQHIGCQNVVSKQAYELLVTQGAEMNWTCDRCGPSLTPATKANHGTRKCKKKVSRGARKRNGKKGKSLKIGYFNIAGSTRKNWDDIIDHSSQREWDIILMTETHWRDRYGGRAIKGYEKVVRNRKLKERKGGGIAMYWKKGLPIYEWDGLTTSNERTWLTLKHGAEQELYIATVYVAIDKPEHDQENDKLLALLTEEIEFLKANGKEVILLGDFNAHFRHLDQVPENGNSARLKSLLEGTALARINDSHKCKGRFTQQRNKSNTVVDYVLADEATESMINGMVIDDIGDIPIASDHNVIEVDLKLEEVERVEQMSEKIWNLDRDINWEDYAKYVDDKVTGWEMHNTDPEKDVASLEELNKWMTESGERFVGYKSKNAKWKRSRKVKAETTRRNILAKHWRKSLLNGTEKSEVEANWKKYQDQQIKVAIMKSELEKKRNERIMQSCDPKKDTCQSLWREMSMMKDQKHEINCLEDGNTTTTDPERIKKS